jgi:hypothetical protein
MAGGTRAQLSIDPFQTLTIYTVESLKTLNELSGVDVSFRSFTK